MLSTSVAPATWQTRPRILQFLLDKIKALSSERGFPVSPTVHFAQHQRLDSVELSIRCQVEFFNVILVDLEEEKYDQIHFWKWENLGGEF